MKKVNVGGQELLVLYCEPLADMPENLRWCPHREECGMLYDAAFGECEDILAALHCDTCDAEEWVVVGVTERGTLVIMEVSEQIGREIRNQIRGD